MVQEEEPGPIHQAGGVTQHPPKSQKEKDITVKGITCEINRIERLRIDNLANLTGPDPKKLGASPITQFLTANGPQEKTDILDMLPDTGAGVTLLSENLVRSMDIKINTVEALYTE